MFSLKSYFLPTVTNKRQRSFKNFFIWNVGNYCISQYVCAIIVEQLTAETIYKEAQRDRLNEALATWETKVLIPESLKNPERFGKGEYKPKKNESNFHQQHNRQRGAILNQFLSYPMYAMHLHRHVFLDLLLI